MRRFKLVLVGAAMMTTMAVYTAPAMAATGHENMGHENNNDGDSVRDDRNVDRDDGILINSFVDRDDGILVNGFLDEFFSPEFLSFEGFNSI